MEDADKSAQDSPLSAIVSSLQLLWIMPTSPKRLSPRLVITSVNGMARRLEGNVGEYAGAGEGGITASAIFGVGSSVGHLSAA